jgi:hypothetical protein
MQEKRRYPRFNASVKIQDNETLKTGWTRDLSLGGCLVEKSGDFYFLPIASRRSFTLAIPGADEPIEVHGIVKHKGKHRDVFGIQFENVDKKCAHYIEKFTGTFL